MKTGQIEKRQIEQIETEQNWKMDKIEIWKQLDKSKKDIIGNRKLKIGQIKNEQNWELKTRQIEKKKTKLKIQIDRTENWTKLKMDKLENTDWQNYLKIGQNWKWIELGIWQNWTNWKWTKLETNTVNRFLGIFLPQIKQQISFQRNHSGVFLILHNCRRSMLVMRMKKRTMEP